MEQLVVTADGIGRVEGTGIHLLDLPHPDLGALLADGGWAAADAAATRATVALDEATLRPPLPGPLAIWGIGLNYRAKAATAGRVLPTEPILFLKPSTALAAPGAVLPVPTPRPAELDYEAELALVIGAPLHEAGPDEAWAAVAGIAPANDMTARDVMRDTTNPTLAKGFMGFSPLGPSIADARGLDDTLDLRIRSWVEGEERQDGRTSDLIFAVSDLLSRLSRYALLRPGDVVLTGTPPGTGQDLGRFLTDGQEVVVEVEGLLPLRNTLGSPTP
ncbi:MAG TPA: fumarylacetoacetate hydrolase family protein [Iamia sp.]|nr:fumarylacetoacetate hydrolase family protein [Iamia sp.]